MWNRLRGWCSDAERMRALHGWLAVLWFAGSYPLAVKYGSSVIFVTFLSLYAIVTGHWSSWQSARVEVNQAQDADVAEVLAEVRRLRAALDSRDST